MRINLRDVFWALVIGTVCLFGFFALTGSWNPVEAPAVGVAVGVLCLLWAAHAYLDHRHHTDTERDPRLRSARERRGF